MIQEFVQQIEETARTITDEIHTALPGKIVSFKANTALASVKPIGNFVTSTGDSMEYPIITDVPVMFPYSFLDKAGIFFPVVKGDSCLIIISEVELDEWRKGAKSDISLRFDMSSAVCIPGLIHKGGSSLEKAINEKAVVISAKNTEVIISNSKVRIAAGNNSITITDTGISLNGNLSVEGDIMATGKIG